LNRCYEDARISDSIITYNGQAGIHAVGCHDVVVNANQLEENEDAVQYFDGFNLTMNGNNVDDHRRHGVVIENTYGSVVAGNMIEECQGAAIVLDRDCYGITLSANVIADDFGGGVDLRDAWGSTVSANTFTICPVRAIRVGPDSGRIAITGNNFSDSYIGGNTRRVGKPNEATGILLEGTIDVAICGNIFTGLTGPAVRADEQCRRLAITDNVMNDLNRSGAEKHPGLDLRGASATVSENNIREENARPAPAKK
jgi:nitrous oxidase accessory protein NosD